MKKNNIDLESLLKLIEKSSLNDDDKIILRNVAESQQILTQIIFELLDSKGYRRAKILAQLAKLLDYKIPPKNNPTSEEHEDKNHSCEEDLSSDSKNNSDTEKQKKSRDKRSISDLEHNKEYHHDHETLKPGDCCPECGRGALYNFEDLVIPIIVGTPPLNREKHFVQRLRCNACQCIFTANLPENIPRKGKGDASAIASIVLLHHKSGLAINQIAEIQKIVGLRITRTEIYEILEQGREVITEVYKALEEHAANAYLFHCDDTGARILSHYKENEQNRKNPRRGKKKAPKDRVATYTSNIIAEMKDLKKIVLFYNGRRYAGENLEAILNNRKHKEDPIVMGDALSQNRPGDHKIIECKCMTHALRKFKELAQHYKEEAKPILEDFRKVYVNDEKTYQFNRQERLEYHKKHSSAVMDSLKKSLEDLKEGNKVEPNSTLGQAIQYTLNNWHGLTQFLRVPGAPLDNNASERALKTPIRLRKNSLFYKNENSAKYSSMIQSIMETAKYTTINTWDYLLNLLENETKAIKSPASWLPWNYKDNLN